MHSVFLIVNPTPHRRSCPSFCHSSFVSVRPGSFFVALVPLRHSCSPFVIPAKAGIQEAHLKRPFVYILASRRNGTFYIGVTSNLAQRLEQHRENAAAGFTRRYGVHTLVWYEAHATMESAITREKALKRWKRAWKVELIEKTNPLWRDLATEVV